jgi:hypothetical protein
LTDRCKSRALKRRPRPVVAILSHASRLVILLPASELVCPLRGPPWPALDRQLSTPDLHPPRGLCFFLLRHLPPSTARHRSRGDRARPLATFVLRIFSCSAPSLRPRLLLLRSFAPTRRPRLLLLRSSAPARQPRVLCRPGSLASLYFLLFSFCCFHL